MLIIVETAITVYADVSIIWNPELDFTPYFQTSTLYYIFFTKYSPNSTHLFHTIKN